MLGQHLWDPPASAPWSLIWSSWPSPTPPSVPSRSSPGCALAGGIEGQSLNQITPLLLEAGEGRAGEAVGHGEDTCLWHSGPQSLDTMPGKAGDWAHTAT